MAYYINNFEELNSFDKLKHSVHNLNIGLLNQLLQDNDYTKDENVLDEHSNIIEWTLQQLNYTQGENPDEFTLKKISIFDFKCVSRDINIEQRKKIYLEILEMLVEKFPKLITDKVIEIIHRWNVTIMIEIVTKYMRDDMNNIDAGNECYVCSLSYADQLINSPCSCKNLVHLHCLIKITKENGDTCRTCRNNFGHQIDNRGRYFYPKIDIYASPLMSNYIMIENDDYKNKLHFAIAYLQVERVLELLSAFTKDMLEDYIKDADYYALHVVSDKKFLIRNMPYTNMSRQKHSVLFEIIECALNYLIENHEIKL